MYLGKIVEIGTVDDIYEQTRHPYTQALLSAMPSMDPDRRIESPPLTGDPPNPINPPSGCRFHTRCPFAETVCADSEPELTTGPATDEISHRVACHISAAGSGHTRAPD